MTAAQLLQAVSQALETVGRLKRNAMKLMALALLLACGATFVGCAAAAPAPGPSRLPCTSLSACDGIYADRR